MNINRLIVAGGLALAIPAAANAATLLSISHDGSAPDVGSFDSNILSQGVNWTATTDDSRSVITANDSATSGNNRLILVNRNDVTEFNSGGGPAGKGWVYEIELELLAGESFTNSGNQGGFAYFGVRSENETGKQAWVMLTEDGGVGGKGQIAFATNGALTGTSADLDVDSLIGDGNYHNFSVYKYEKSGTTVVEVYLDGSLVLESDYADLTDDFVATDIQGFASATPSPSSQVNIDFINFTLYDNLTESAVPEPGSLALLGLGGLLIARRRR